MKRDWDARAERNAMHYISSSRADWDIESFFQWGERQTQLIIDRFLVTQNFNPKDKIMLEIGCGVGRMTRALSSRFRKIYAFDVSDKMIKIAKDLNPRLDNVEFCVNDGMAFPEISGSSIDFVFSGWVCQHMPTKEVVIKNIDEMSRCLKKGGLYKFNPTLYACWTRMFRIMPVPRRIIPQGVISPLRQKYLTFRGVDYLKNARTFIGVGFTKNELDKILSERQLTINYLKDDGIWLYGRKL